MVEKDGALSGSDAEASGQAVVTVPIHQVDGARVSERGDVLAAEEPLEIRIGLGPADCRTAHGVSVTMRTPGSDFELAVGFLFTEGVLRSADQVARVRHAGRATRDGGRNVVRVDLAPGVEVDLGRLERHFYTASSCGVCGKTSIEAVETCQVYAIPRGSGPLWDPDVIHRAPDALREAQAVFDRTGGLHAAALFDADGRLSSLREDVGRHNALDKLIGAQFLANALPLGDRLLLVSGRASFELVQKAMMAGIPILAAVGAPSSLAVELARDRGMTLLGFVRGGRFNVYSGGHRIQGVA